MSVSTRTTALNPPCRCGGDCGCTSGVCGEPESQGLSRPQFFAGQLLTDEDLQAALDYVVQKNRLHNRHFFGDGVVCGLQVQRHPCPDQQRKVVVRAGHALDCCGNDVVVPGEVEVDILKKVRELQAKRNGEFDCGDPCNGKGKSNGKTTPSDDAASDAVDDARHKYLLYVRYHERPSDPVTPYQVEGDCGDSCQASRIREGYCFELRCPEDAPPAIDLRSQLEECKNAVPGYQELQGDTLHGVSALEMAEKVLVQFDVVKQMFDHPELPETPLKDIPNDKLDLFKAKLPEPFKNMSQEQLRTQTLADLKKVLSSGLLSEIQAMLGAVLKADLILDLRAAAQAVDAVLNGLLEPVPVESQREAATTVHRFLTLAYRVLYTPSGSPVPVEQVVKDVQNRLVGDLPKLKDVDRRTAPNLPPASEAVLDLLIERNGRLEDAFVNGEDGKSFDGKARIVGELVGLQIVDRAVKRLDDVNETLRGLVASGVVAIDPGLRAEMRALQLGSFNMAHQLTTLARLKTVQDQANVVSRAVAEISKHCLCEIVLPPCPPCDDPAVLLATITVQKCEVVEVCNLHRKFVITGPSLRYWFSDFNVLFDPIRSACCPTPASIVKAKNAAKQRNEQRQAEWKAEATVSDPGATPFVPALAERIDKADTWTGDLHVSPEVSELGQAAVEPPEDNLFEEVPLDDRKAGLGRSPQALNFALAHLAGTPPSDIRDLLDWSEPLESPASIKRFAENVAKEEAEEAKVVAEAAEKTADLAKRESERAKNTADDARQKAVDASDVTKDPLKTIKQDIADAGDVTKDPLKTIKQDIADAGDVTKDPLKTIKQDISDAVDVTKDPLKTIKQGIADAGDVTKDPLKTIKQGIADAGDVTKDPLKTIKQDIADAVDVTKDPLKTIKQDIADAVDVAKDPLKTIKQELAAKVDSATVNSLRSEFETHKQETVPPAHQAAPPPP